MILRIMKTSYLAKILFFVLSSLSFAHEDEHSAAEYARAFDRLYERALKEVFTGQEELARIPEAELGYLLYGKEKLPFKRSAVLGLLADVLAVDDAQRKLFCSGQCANCPCGHQPEEVKKTWKKTLLAWASAPLSLFKEVAQDPAGFLLAPSVRLTREYGALTFATIVVTQVSWEALESVLSWAMGTGGAHFYCVAFNIALMSFVQTANSSVKMSCSLPHKEGFFKRLGSATKNFVYGLRYPRSLAKFYLSKIQGVNYLSKRKDFEEYNAPADSALRDTLYGNGFFAVDAAQAKFKERTSPLNPSVFRSLSWGEDWKNLAEAKDAKERWVIWKLHISALEVFGKLVQKQADEKRKKVKGLPRWGLKPYLRLHFELGNWLSRLRKLQSQGLILALGPDGDNLEKWQGLAEAEKELFAQIRLLSDNLNEADRDFERPSFQDFDQKLKDATKAQRCEDEVLASAA
jgi:hypothetical protein